MDLLFKYLKNSLDNLVFLGLFIGVLGYWISVAFPSFKIGSKIGFYSVLSSNIFITIILTWRWIESGYFPLSNLYESLLFFTWGITFIALILEFVTSLNLLGAIISPLAMFIVGFATLSLPDGMQKAAPLVPALKSNWLMMHVSIMMFSYSTLIIGSLLSIVFLILTRGRQVNLKGSSVGNITIQETGISEISEVQPQDSYDGVLRKKLNLLLEEMTKKKRYEQVIGYFLENNPFAETELEYQSPYQLLVAVILSAQCTDKRVNIITPAFFEKYPEAIDLASANIDDILFFSMRRFFSSRNKTNSIFSARVIQSKTLF